MKKSKIIFWKILLIIGIIPFVIPLLGTIYNIINKTPIFCFGINCNHEYGISTLIEWIFLYSSLFWSTYIIGLILMIIAILKLKKKRN